MVRGPGLGSQWPNGLGSPDLTLMFLFTSERAQFCLDASYEFSIWHPHASVWCFVRFSSREGKGLECGSIRGRGCRGGRTEGAVTQKIDLVADSHIVRKLSMRRARSHKARGLAASSPNSHVKTSKKSPKEEKSRKNRRLRRAMGPHLPPAWTPSGPPAPAQRLFSGV